MSKGGDGPQETPEERELATIATEEYARFEKVFKPLEDYLITELTGENQQRQFREEALGITAADTNAAFDQVQDQAEAGFAARGARPGSGAFAGGEGDVALARGEALGTGLARTNTRVHDREAASLTSLIGLGRGQASNAQLGLGRIAALANRDAILDAEAAARAREGYAGAIGAGAGLVVGGLTPNKTAAAPSSGGSGMEGVTPTFGADEQFATSW